MVICPLSLRKNIVWKQNQQGNVLETKLALLPFGYSAQSRFQNCSELPVKQDRPATKYTIYDSKY